MKQVKKAIIPAAGFGTRFLPITKGISKEMLPIIDVPTIELIIQEAVAAGISEILLIINEHKQDIINYFRRNQAYEEFVIKNHKEQLLEVLRHSEKLATIKFVYQVEQKGLGHAVLMAKDFVGNEPFAVLLGDDLVVSSHPAIAQLIEAYNKYHCSVVGVQKVAKSAVNKYGIIAYDIQLERAYRLTGMVEKPTPEKAPSSIASLGRYVLTPEIFDVLEHQTPGVGGEIQLTDAILNLMQQKDVYAYDFEGERYDVGTQFGYVKAILDFALTRADLKDDVKKYLKEKGEEI